MRKIAVLICVAGLWGCNEKKDAPAQGKTADNSGFDEKWKAVTGGEEPAYIESQKGGGLMGEVRRAVDPTKDGNVPSLIQGTLPDPVAASVVRRNMGAVKGCYEVEERAGAVGSGKAIVSLEIQESGAVRDVSVDAPAFSASKLPDCIRNNARNWMFPKFTTGPKKFSYPFVFVGG
jgi:hypothetical protein